MGIEECRDDRRDMAAAELDRCGNTQQAAHRRLAHTQRRGLVVAQHDARLVVEQRPASVGARRRVVRSIRRTPSRPSSEASARVTAGGDRRNRLAARTRLLSSTMRTKIASSSSRSIDYSKKWNSDFG